MNSTDLIPPGFREWAPFNLQAEKVTLAHTPRQCGVYVVRSPRPFGRFRGESDIVYVGSASNANGLKRRIRSYFHPGPSMRTSLRIRSKLDLIDDLHISCRITLASEDPRDIEHEILLAYEREHLELPPFNRQE